MTENGRDASSDVGNAHVLQIRCGWGRGEGHGMKVKLPAGVELKSVPGVEGLLLEGTVSSPWKRIAVRTWSTNGMRMWVLEPAESAGHVTFQGYFVTGHFQVTEKINNPRKIKEAWKTFQPE